jgi:hypothetical protein
MAFEMPPTLLALLDARRSAQRQERPPTKATGPKTMSIADLAASAAHASPSALAANVVGAMNSMQREVEDQYDAFLIDPGMGPMTYITRDGRVLWDMRSWQGDEVREVHDSDAFTSIAVGARKTGIPELLSILPPRPADSSSCPKCMGTRSADIVPGAGHVMICALCNGLGWTTKAMVEAGRARGVVW